MRALNGLYARRVRLTSGPTATAQARERIWGAICAWEVPVNADVAVLLTSELVTNAILQIAGEGIRCAWLVPRYVPKSRRVA